MEEYERIENRMLDMYDTPSASNKTVRTPTSGGQELELWSLAGEVRHQMGVKLEGN